MPCSWSPSSTSSSLQELLPRERRLRRSRSTRRIDIATTTQIPIRLKNQRDRRNGEGLATMDAWMGKGGGQGGCLRLGGHIRDVYDEKDEVED